MSILAGRGGWGISDAAYKATIINLGPISLSRARALSLPLNMIRSIIHRYIIYMHAQRFCADVQLILYSAANAAAK
jgi:hypothetical protein